MVDQLRGFRIGVTSDRRSEDLIAALERRGAAVTHAPALRIARNEQDAILVRETRQLVAARPEVVLITTGYGMRRWFEVADAAGLGGELTAVLEQAKIFARGPKAIGAVRAAGLVDAQASDADTTASLVDALVAAGLTGRRVAIQLHGFTDETQLAPAAGAERGRADGHALPLDAAGRAGAAEPVDRGGLPTAARRADLHQRARRGGDAGQRRPACS